MKRTNFVALICLSLLIGCMPNRRQQYIQKQDSKLDLKIKLSSISRQEQNYDLSLCDNIVKNPKAKMYNKENIDVLIKILDEKNKLKKGEFETSEEFTLRKNKAIDNIKKQMKAKTGTEYILYEYIPKSEYDADMEMLTISKPSFEYLEDDYKSKCYDSYIAENAFGAQVEVSKCNMKEILVELKIFSDEYLALHKKAYNNTYYVEPRSELPGSERKGIIIEKDKAKKLKDNIRLLIVADVDDTKTYIEKFYKRATYDEPYEGDKAYYSISLHPVTACYYDKKTKEVYSLY